MDFVFGLALDSYPFGNDYTPTGAIKSTPGYPGTGSEVDYWADVFDWSQLQVLRTTNKELGIRVMSRSPSLRRLQFIAG